MNKGDWVRIKSTGQEGIIEFPSVPYQSLFRGQIIQGNTVPSVLVLDGDTIKHIGVHPDDLEVLE